MPLKAINLRHSLNQLNRIVCLRMIDGRLRVTNLGEVEHADQTVSLLGGLLLEYVGYRRPSRTKAQRSGRDNQG